jgi:hypothetical protein
LEQPCSGQENIAGSFLGLSSLHSSTSLDIDSLSGTSPGSVSFCLFNTDPGW